MRWRLMAGLVALWLCLIPNWSVAGILGKITLKDGSRVYGEIVGMTEGMLTVNTLFHDGDPLKIKWSEVTGIDAGEPLTFVLTGGAVLQGSPGMTQPGTLDVTTAFLPEPIPIQIESIVAVNPPVKKAVVYTGNVNFGASKTTGNTQVQNYSFVGELIARSERLRLSLLGRYLYGENDNELVARNAFGTIKLDFFVTERFFVNTGALFEQDTFQDLNLRTSLFAGPGYQFIDTGDFSSTYLNKMQLSGEIGLGFYNEDFKQARDRNNVTGRWAVNFNWPVRTWLTLFHQHQAFPSLEKSKDYYVTSQQGVRLAMWENLIATFQVNWRYDNSPAPGNKKGDTQYLLTLGYAFES